MTSLGVSCPPWVVENLFWVVNSEWVVLPLLGFWLDYPKKCLSPQIDDKAHK